METESPELSEFAPKEIVLGQEFVLFPHSHRTEFILDVGKYQLPLDVELVGDYPCTLLDTITPFDPTLGYQITQDDFELHTREAKVKKILQENSIENDLVAPLKDHVYVTMSSLFDREGPIKDEEFNQDYFKRLNLVIQANKQSFVGITELDHNKLGEPIDFFIALRFLPAEIPSVLPWDTSLEYVRDKDDNTLDNFESTYREGNGVVFKQGYKVGVPKADKEKVQSITGKFLLSPHALELGPYR